jgi:hypothetical protein
MRVVPAAIGTRIMAVSGGGGAVIVAVVAHT